MRKQNPRKINLERRSAQLPWLLECYRESGVGTGFSTKEVVGDTRTVE